MKLHFDCTENVEYDTTTIHVHWIRKEFKQKTKNRVFENDDGMITIEKDYISFDYNGITVYDNYESDKYNLCNRVYELCSIIDTKGTEGLTALNINWRKALSY